MPLLHDLSDFSDLIDATAGALAIDPSLVEKDYWIMHALWGLQQLGLRFELKGGTSLSKGYRLIDRFSEDIDILIHPTGDVPTSPNATKPAQVEKRRAFYDGLCGQIAIAGIKSVERDHVFDDERMGSAGIRLHYPSINPLPDGVKTGILLEVGFDQVSPNRPCDIASWAYDQAVAAGVRDIIDNRALGVACYEPGYTLVEKLQTISTKYRRQQASGEMPKNFMRHYYDVYCLLGDEAVQSFIGSDAYRAHKAKRFPNADEPNLTRNAAFLFEDASTRVAYARAYADTQALYYRGQPPFDDVIDRLHAYLDRL